MDITLRDATVGDLDFIAWVQLQAARSHLPLSFWDLALPGPEAPRLALIARVIASAPEHFGSLSGFIVAECDGKPVAALSGYDPKHKPLDNFVVAMFAALEAAHWSEVHRSLVPGRVAPVMACMSDAPDDHWIVEWVAAEPEVRGKGVASRLLDAILERGRSLGFKRAQISHIIGNAPAQRTYERAGFRQVEERCDATFAEIFGSPGIARMQMDL